MRIATVTQSGGSVTVMKVKDIRLKVIPAKLANEFVKKYHYSGKVVPNSRLHFGAFYKGVLHGVMSYGSPLDKRRTIGLVKGTGWNEMLELNRMAFDDVLPKNAESRCIAISIKLIKKNAPQIKWILSFSDCCQCGDGTIYRASGFYLTNIKKNTTIWEAPNGEVATDISLRLGFNAKKVVVPSMTSHQSKKFKGASSMKIFKEAGYKPLEGYQLRYVYFIDKEKKKDLTVPIIPFKKLKELGIAMYKGKKLGVDGVKVARHTTSVEEEVQYLPQRSN
ncbi:MAG: putative adenine modification enzyme [Prokaryotic dsDNA virus sp.]|nr:MAG: putative adenine modification enzyme [Prokaryotic dsDNA virus sp.]